MVQLITGHNFLQRHKVIVQEDVDPLCRSCGEDEETSHHVVAECPAFAAIRLRVLGTPVLQGTLHWSTKIAEFLREINFSSLQDQAVEQRWLLGYRIPKGEGIMVRKRTGRVQFLVFSRLWTGPPQNNNNNMLNMFIHGWLFKYLFEKGLL